MLVSGATSTRAFALPWQVEHGAPGMAVYAARIGDHLAGFGEESGGAGARIGDRREGGRRSQSGLFGRVNRRRGRQTRGAQ
jgi:hypothetical protein